MNLHFNIQNYFDIYICTLLITYKCKYVNTLKYMKMKIKISINEYKYIC